jgi:NAD(P)-dependent dehydrogenase (short-subunit alcohol dehydrogenase family)
MDLGIAGRKAWLTGDAPCIVQACCDALSAEGVTIARDRNAAATADIIVSALAPRRPVEIEDIDGDARDFLEAWDGLSGLCEAMRGPIAHMSRTGFGRVIFILPDAPKTLEPGEIVGRVLGLGMLGLQKNLGGEYGESGLTANSILYDAARRDDAAMTSEIGALCAYYASRPAAYLTGTVMTVDGGKSRSIF